MESEEVLTSIMSKLKEYKSNPLPSPDEEKERQKNLMKMFCIYTSLKKREKAKQKQKEQDAAQNVKNQLNLENCNQISEIDTCENDRVSSDNSTESMNIHEIKVENENVMENISYEPKELCSPSHVEEYISDEPKECSDFSPMNEEYIKTESEYNETEESCDENVEEHEHSLNHFLIQLSERFKKLPYRHRSKLEIEFFRRLIEVEERLGSYN